MILTWLEDGLSICMVIGFDSSTKQAKEGEKDIIYEVFIFIFIISYKLKPLYKK